MPSCCRSLLLCTAVALCGGFPLVGQEIPKPDYVTYLPRETPRAVTRPAANVTFQLYGNPAGAAWRDADPVDGIDDARGALLLRLAERFAPWVARTSYGFPMDARRFVASGATSPLVRDIFDLARPSPALVRSDSIALAGLASAPCPVAAPPGDPRPDCRLRELLRTLGPQAPRIIDPIGADRAIHEVLYLNFPGDSPESWAAEYEGATRDGVAERYLGWAKTMVHPFIVEAGDGFEFVLQYWLFYPTNDAGNVHEGDWEHLNVVIAPRESVTRPFVAAELRALLEGTLPLEELVIRRVEHFFHYWILPLDYSRPNVYAPRDAWEREVETLPTTRRGQAEIWRLLRERAWADDAETVPDLHPRVFIGGNDHGLNLLLAGPTRLGRSSHGSYPFPGLFKGIGPAGTGESIDLAWDVFDDPPAADAPESERVVRYDHPSRLEILPDWEMIADRAIVEPEIRERWGWLLLPLRVGYPASVSPFAGVVRYAETGNLALPPPFYSGGWNRSGPGPGHALYEFHRVPEVFPKDLQDTFRPNWGVYNLTVPVVSILPPFDVALRALGTPIRALRAGAHPTYVRSEDLPVRGIGLGLGLATFDPGNDFWRLVGFPELAGPFLQEITRRTGSAFSAGLLPVRQERLRGVRGELSLHLGDRFVSTNALLHGRARYTQGIAYDGGSQGDLAAEINFWEYTGSLRYNLRTDVLQPFVLLGYGLSWYRLEDVTAFGEPLGDGASRWVRRPGLFRNLLPNTWHFGAGVELLPVRGVSSVDLGVKATANYHLHDLGLATGDATTLFFQNTSVHRWVLGLVATLSY
ncbi:MAG TPA: hypothetical protein P5135_06535 [Gemmatimonadales bacterium]|nr:hypothetical protein [Gemmatimonadales bacterium]